MPKDSGGLHNAHRYGVFKTIIGRWKGSSYSDYPDEAKQRLTLFENDEDEGYSEELEEVDLDDRCSDHSDPGLYPVRSSRLPLFRRILLLTLALILLVASGLAVVFRDDLGYSLPYFDVAPLMNVPPDEATLGPRNWRRAVIVSSFQKQDVAWLDEINQPKDLPDWEVYRYISDPAGSSDGLRLDNKDGRESLAYLTYIIDNYDNLPDFCVFTHGHRIAWHQPSPMPYKLWSLNTTALWDEGYFSIRCQSKGCTDDTMYYYDGTHKQDVRGGARPVFRKFWKEMMSPRFGRLPRRIGRPCCGQFAASKRAILGLPLSFWTRLREPLMSATQHDYEFRNPSRGAASGYDAGLMYEQIWGIVMGTGFEKCPSDDTCNKVYFQDWIHCDRPPSVQGQPWKDNKCTFDMPESSLDSDPATNASMPGIFL